MSSILASIAVLVPPWKRKKSVPRFSCSLNDDSVPVPKKSQPKVSFDPFEEFYGLEVKRQPSASIPRSWVGPNGQYIRELPCPSCRGRGYTLCTECGIERPRLDCSHCNGKGLKTCPQCMGDCVIWEESIDERPWEKARSISRFKVKEDDEVDDLDIKLDARKKSKRLYQSPPPEVGLKISRSLRSLNAKTGLFTKRMKIIHQDPMLHAQRVAAIKKTKQTAAARKQASEAMKAFFRDPANRHKRSIAMKGVKFYCQNCGREGHRRHYCPELKLLERRFRCGLCGEEGHNRRSCQMSSSGKSAVPRADRLRHRNHGNNNANYGRTSQETDIESGEIDGTSTSFLAGRRKYRCRLCQEKGHNWRTCPNKMSNEISKNES